MTDENKTRIKQQILEKLTKNFTISFVCHAVGIDRKTFYRWADEDNEFKGQAYENIQESKKDITDMAYNVLPLQFFSFVRRIMPYLLSIISVYINMFKSILDYHNNLYIINIY